MLSKLHTLGLRGIEGFDIRVEVDIAAGLPSYAVVGLPDAGIKESKDRVVAAVRNSGFDFPVKRITVNLAPAEVKKTGTHFDLPIALGVLAASGKVGKEAAGRFETSVFIGELALDGALRPVVGVLPMLLSLKKAGVRGAVIVPRENSAEAALSGLECLAAGSLREVLDWINGAAEIPACFRAERQRSISVGDFSEVKSQAFAKRALEIAAAGGHNVRSRTGAGRDVAVSQSPHLNDRDTVECITNTPPPFRQHPVVFAAKIGHRNVRVEKTVKVQGFAPHVRQGETQFRRMAQDHIRLHGPQPADNAGDPGNKPHPAPG